MCCCISLTGIVVRIELGLELLDEDVAYDKVVDVFDLDVMDDVCQQLEVTLCPS